MLKHPLVLLLAALLSACAAAPAFATNFTPCETIPLTAGTSSTGATFTLTATCGTSPDVMVTNAGTTTVFFGCGGSGVAAQAPTPGALNATPVGPGVMSVFTRAGLTCAAITLSGTDTVYFTSGTGN